MKTTQLELIALIEGEVTTATLASRHGVSEQEILGWRAAFVGGMKAGAAGAIPPRRPRARWFAALAVVGTVAFAQLTTFSANSPALASEVNGNFATLKTWLEQKVGPVTTNNITTTGSVTAGASVSTAGDLTVSGHSTLGGVGKTLTVTGTVAAFGLPSDVTNGTIYIATSDGFVNAMVTATGTCTNGYALMVGYAGMDVRQQTTAHGGCAGTNILSNMSAFSMPLEGNGRSLTVSGTVNASPTRSPSGRGSFCS